ncbi:sugar ABC transporter substrate-binding protein [Neotabrizicola shimadae]|uniref:Sugar ABC transporter substrate-binding protein n=1 Tax=Neotabrizicola shimadae TaxID=2807096 RepID=A0A8G0ZVE7_9RHOB|nr:sugar ABC transporter substrate-binding protein [Neotabrizicola shimadae]QYZ69606.1 sugar ABC transporter substrate-binding protein [Neotabrizicola shimadae]
MRRTILSALGALALATALVPATASAQSVDIGFAVPDTTNPFLGWLTSEVQKQAEAAGMRLEIADAGASPVKQMEQIENFIAMGVKVIDIMPVDPNNVQDVIARAQAQGIKVLVQGTDTGVYDVMMNIDQYNAGEQAAEMAIDWLTTTFPEGGAKVAIIPATDTVDAKNRSQGMIDTMTKWGKAEIVTSPTEARSTAQGTSVMETLLLQNPDLDAVLTYNADTAMGVNEYVMGQAQVDHAKFGVFTGDWSPPVQETINASANNESVFRGTIRIVGPMLDGQQVDLPIATFTIMKALSEGQTPYGKWVKDTIAKAGPEAN